MREPIFDIFSGTGKADALWLEAVEGLANAQKRMGEIASKEPGPYFIFFAQDGAIVASVETSGDAQPAKARSASS